MTIALRAGIACVVSALIHLRWREFVMIKSVKVPSLRPPLREHPWRSVRWDLYDFEGTTTRPAASCWQTLTMPAQEFYQSNGELQQLRYATDFVGSLRHGWRRRKRRPEELVETSLAEYQHPILQYGLTTPHRDFWPLDRVDQFDMDRWEVADRIRGLHLLVVEFEKTVGLVPLDEATPWHLAFAFLLLGYLPPHLELEPWAEAVLYLDVPSIRRVREGWVEKHRRIIQRSKDIIETAKAWVPEPTNGKVNAHGT